MSEPRPILKLPLAIAFIAALLLWPVVGVSRPMPADFLTAPELSVYAIIFFTACLTSWEKVASIFAFNRRNIKSRLHVLGWSVYFALFLSCCLLCRRLKICIIHIHDLSAQPGAWVGTALALIGALFILLSLDQLPVDTAEESFSWLNRRNLGLLFILAGVSLAHWAWFPLLALPGVLVALSWYGRRKSDISRATGVV